MAKLINSGAQPITLPAGHVIPARGALDTTNDVIRGDNWPTLNALILSGQIGVTYDPEPEATDAAEPQIKKMKGA